MDLTSGWKESVSQWEENMWEGICHCGRFGKWGLRVRRQGFLVKRGQEIS